MSRASRPVLEAEARNMFGRKENFLTFRTCCNEGICYQSLVGWGGSTLSLPVALPIAKTSVESSSWSFTGLFARSFTGPFDHSYTGVFGRVIHRALRGGYTSLASPPSGWTIFTTDLLC